MSKAKVDLSGARILIVDDVPANLGLLSSILEGAGYRVQAATNGETALRIVEAGAPDLIFLDVMMPGLDGLETCRRLKSNPRTKDVPVLFLTARAEPDDAVEGLEAGAVDYITKPFSPKEALARAKAHLENAFLQRALQERTAALEAEIERRNAAEEARETADARLSAAMNQERERWGIDGLVGAAPRFQEVARSVRALQRVDKTSALITGESGVGKEMIARAIHFGSSRGDRPFVAVNCAAIPDELAESTLFGHMKGAFTGALEDRKGLFEQADGGSLFLDEVGEMPVGTQATLLRALEEGVILPVGASRERAVDVRVIAATNVDFETQIAEGDFREDLYYRLARFVLTVPPLRERREDIPDLVDRFLRGFAEEMGLERDPQFDADALDRLLEYSFPGNIRELKNVVERAMLEATGPIIGQECLRFLAPRGGSEPSTRAAENPLRPDAVADREALARSRAVESGEDGDEARLMELARERPWINNADCRAALNVDRHRAGYLLKKLCQYGALEQRGSGRWAVYRVARDA